MNKGLLILLGCAVIATVYFVTRGTPVLNTQPILTDSNTPDGSTQPTTQKNILSDVLQGANISKGILTALSSTGLLSALPGGAGILTTGLITSTPAQLGGLLGAAATAGGATPAAATAAATAAQSAAANVLAAGGSPAAATSAGVTTASQILATAVPILVAAIGIALLYNALNKTDEERYRKQAQFIYDATGGVGFGQYVANDINDPNFNKLGTRTQLSIV